MAEISRCQGLCFSNKTISTNTKRYVEVECDYDRKGETDHTVYDGSRAGLMFFI